MLFHIFLHTSMSVEVGVIGHELLTIIVHCVPILLSTLESYRFCPLIRQFVSFPLTNLLNESCEMGSSPFLTRLAHIASAFNSRRNSAQALLLHLHLIKKAHKGGLIFIKVEMARIEPASESGCDCESTVCRTFFNLSV